MRILRSMLFALGASLLLMPGVHAQSTAAPDALIRDLSTEVLGAIKSNQALKSGDASQVQKLVDDKVLPHTDFQKMTQLSVGPGWRNATPEQRAALTREFRTLLIRTYSGALAQVSDHKVEMRPFRAQPSDNDVIVRTQIVASRGDPIQLDYRLEKTDAGWKIYDINILGVWLVENYKSQFSSQVNAGGVDSLIKALADRNKQLAQGKKA